MALTIPAGSVAPVNITGNAATVTTNANLTGEATSAGNAATLTNSAVIGKVLTGYSSGAGTVAATDTILQAINKLNGNDATNANLTGPITSTGNATAVAAQTGTGTTFVMDTSPTLVTPLLGTPTSGTLTNCTADGTNSVGFRTIPQNSQSAAYTTVLADSGKHIFHPSGDANARTFTIDSNANVAYPVGTALTFINMTAQVVTIAITSDTMYLSSAGTTGSRSLAQYGVATAIKMTSTTWIVSGSGLT